MNAQKNPLKMLHVDYFAQLTAKLHAMALIIH